MSTVSLVPEIVVASGKGGTGKTFIASNLLYYLRHYASKNAVGVDADAEAPDLALALGGYQEIKRVQEVEESRKAVIDENTCTQCLTCVSICRFAAITVQDGRPVVIEEYCEGCGACALVCPAGAIKCKVVRTGKLILGRTKTGIDVVTADLEVSGRNTGHLVYMAREFAKSLNPEIIVVDAAAGIGCPVISSLVGAAHLVVVVEPTPQSLQGAERLTEVASKLNIPYSVIINKADLNPDFRREIESRSGSNEVGEIPYSDDVVKYYVNMTPLLSTREHPLSKQLVDMFEKILSRVRKW